MPSSTPPSAWCASGRLSFYDERYSNTDLKDGHGTARIPDFVKLGEAYGCATFRCERDEDVDATIKAALRSTTALWLLTSP